jgi:hypothetical protein
MYNANRLAGRAEKAEREGRTFDASSFWGQVVVKADSVLARHPDSKWADDARLLRGRGLARLGRCDAAIPELARAQQELVEPDLKEQAALDLGRCQLESGDPAAAEIALAPLQESVDPERRAASRRLLGRARVAAGDYAGALPLLEGASDSIVAASRLLALAGSGRLDEARGLADTLIEAGTVTAPWGEFLRELGRRDPALAAGYLDRIRTLSIDPGLIAAWMLEDADRRLDTDEAGALARIEEAEQLAPGTEAASVARVRRLRRALADVSTPADLSQVIERLSPQADDVPSAGDQAAQLLAAAQVVTATADSVRPTVAQGDLMLFLAAELARDSLRAPRLAATLMRRVAGEWPESPYAPKALLALVALDSSAAEAARLDLETLYGASPYVAVTHGIADSTYRTLEDSLGTFAAAWRQAAGDARTPAAVERRPGERRPRPGVAEPDRRGRREARPGVRGAEPL